MADTSEPRVLVSLVCLTCGNEKSFTDRVPEALTCDKCAGTVFRQFDTPTAPDDVTIAQLEQTARSLSYGDPSPDSSRAEVRDLDTR